VKLLFLPFFHPSSFSQHAFQGVGTEFLSAYTLTTLHAFLAKHFPELELVMEITLPRLLAQRPDLVLLWSTTHCFGQVPAAAQMIKQNLEVPIILAGPHISHLPQSLPADVDIAILGEPEIPMHQLLTVFSKDLRAGPIKYGKIPGLIYQSRGRIYSGSPAKYIQNLEQLPLPRHNLLHALPGHSVPVIQVSRGSPFFLSLLTQPPAPRVRYFSPERTVAEIEQIVADYRHLYRNWPVPPEALASIFPIYIADEMFLAHPERMQAVCEGILQRKLHQAAFFMVSAFPAQLNEQIVAWLAKINVRKMILSFGSFSRVQVPWMPESRPEHLRQAIQLCHHFRIGLTGSYLVNPHLRTTRQEIARTYWFIKEHLQGFEQVQPVYLPPLPGTPLWEAYQQKYKPDPAQPHFPWHLFDSERMQASSAFVHHTFTPETFYGMMQSIRTLSHPLPVSQQIERAPMNQDKLYQSQKIGARALEKKYLTPGMKILEILIDEHFSLQPYLLETSYQFQRIAVSAGQLSEQPRAPVDLIVMQGAVSALRHPVAVLQSLKDWLLPGGKILISVPHAQNIAVLLQFFNSPFELNQYSARVLRYFSESSIRRVIQQAGLEIEAMEYTIMNKIQDFKEAAEGLLQRIKTFQSLPVSQERLYILEINLLVKQNRK
jgi:radical SAM superfamily enzyme YgiQ (UPF0313 family)